MVVTAPSWPLAPVRCAAPEPVALLDTHARAHAAWRAEEVARLARGDLRVYVSADEVRRLAATTCAPARGRCGR